MHTERNLYYLRASLAKRQTDYIHLIANVLCGFVAGYAFLIFFVLALNVSNMTVGRIRHIGDSVSVSFPLPLSPHSIELWHTDVETLEMVKIIASLVAFAIISIVFSIIFLKMKNIYNILLILGLEYLPMPIVGNYFQAQGFALYLMMFIIGFCLICYSSALRIFFRRTTFNRRYGYP